MIYLEFVSIIFKSKFSFAPNLLYKFILKYPAIKMKIKSCKSNAISILFLPGIHGNISFFASKQHFELYAF